MTPARIVAAAVTIADEHGLEAVTMRAVATRFGVTPMALYHHLATKDALLSAMADAVFAEIELAPAGDGWRERVRAMAVATRAALLEHPWAIRVVESSAAPGEATIRRHDALLGHLRADGFSVCAAAHALAVLDSYVYGFVVQDVNLPAAAEDGEAVQEIAAGMMGVLGDRYPHLAELAREVVLRSGYTFSDEFPVGLELVLDGIAALRA